MSRRHKSQEHIRAARDWLGEAEHSLAREDDIQGDLKVMLAKAELAQVQDSPRTSRLRRWGKWLLPPVTAVLLVTAAFAGWQYYTSVPAAPAEPTVITVQADNAADKTQEASADAPVTVTPPPGTLPAATAQAEAEVVTPAPALEPPPAPVLTPAPAIVETQESAVAPQTAAGEPPTAPDARKQRLMQAAGQVLKAP